MRILLTSNASYDPPRGGSTRSNLAWLRQLAAAGHECVVVSGSTGGDTETESAGIRILSYRDLARRTDMLHAAIGKLLPDWVLVTSEDVGHTLLREAAHSAPGRLIFLAHTPQWFPFGAQSWHPDPAAADIVRHARAVVAIGRHMAGYIERAIGVRPAVVHPPIYGTPPFPRFGRFGDGFVLLINPCEVKGIRIFAALAARYPEIPFAGLTGWGTTRADRELLARYPNVELLGAVGSIDEVLSRARLLLMPSLWYEGFGLIAMEALLRGVPVVASDSGGLEEAKQGTGYVIPVKPITQWLRDFDENGMPRAVVPDQDIEPWVAALKPLLADERAYREESERSRQAGERFVSQVDPAGLEHLLAGLRTPSMRILLAHNSLYFPSHGGGDKSNRILMESLAARGHQVRVVARMERFSSEAHTRLLDDLAERGVFPENTGEGVVSFRHNGVDVRTLTENPRLRSYFEQQIAEFDPEVIVTSTDDPAQLLFEIAAASERAHVVYLVRATIAVPFGPDASSLSAERTAALARADGIVTVSEYVARYVCLHGGLDAVHLPISLPETGPFPNLGRFDNPYVTLVNPCAVKGIGILLDLARLMPHLQFAAVPTWGATAADIAALRSLPNVTILPPADNIDEILRVSRVLLVPSVWAEARSRIVLEAMERGVPVMAANLGGLPEAKLGIPYVLPVVPIRGYRAGVDENMVPIADVPPQDVRPWMEVLGRLTSDPVHWSEIADLSRRAALEYGERAGVGPFEAFLADLVSRPKRPVRKAQAPPSALDRLSPERRRLLAIRLRRKAGAAGQNWFAGLEEAPRDVLRLFCFPHAGGGSSSFAEWRAAMLPVAAVCPVRLPGRESRIGEPPIDDMGTLVRAVADALEPHVSVPFALFGHSMGAGVAFEVARELRRRGLPLPAALGVSGTRAPQLRAGETPPPDPADTELLAQLRRLGGLPEDVLQDPATLALVLPALRADLRLYRRYLYTAEEPLPVPIAAYAASADPNVRVEQVEAWREQTLAEFRFRTFCGGHFFLQRDRAAFLEALAADLADLTGQA